MSIAHAIARQPSAPCAGKCGRTWNNATAWATCWTCPGGPLAFCPSCRERHFESAACADSHRRRGVAVDPTGEVLEVAAA